MDGNWQGVAYVVIGLVLANYLWLRIDDEEGPYRIALAVVLGAAWPLWLLFAGIAAAAWLITLPAQKLETKYLRWRKSK